MVHRSLLSRLQPAARSLQPALLVLLLAAAGPARAEDRAEDLLREGVRLYSLARFEQALGVLRKAVTAGGSSESLAQVNLYKGLCEVELGDERKARESMGAALDLAPNMRLDPRKFKRSACQLFDQVRSERLGVLRVEADRSGALVRLDGQEVGTVPFEGTIPAGPHQLVVRSADGSLGYSGTVKVVPRVQTRVVLALRPLGGLLSVRTSPRGAEVLVDGELFSLTPVEDLALEPGVHALTVRLPGHQEQTRTVELRAGQQLRLDLDLQPTGVQPASPGPVAASESRTGEERRPAGFWSRRRVWTWVALGAAGASAIAAGAVYGSASSDHDEYTSTQDPDRFYELESQIDDKLLASNILWGLTGAFAATAVVLLILEGRPSTSDPAAETTKSAIRLFPLAGPGLALEGRF